MLITTTEEVPEKEIKNILGVVFGSCVQTKHLGKDIGAGLRSVVGGEARGYTEMLEEARHLEPLETRLKEARLSLEELEMRRSIRDVSDDEYRVKTPAIRWEIENCEEGLKAKRAKITYLHDLKSVISDGEIADLQEKAERCIRNMGKEDRPWEASSETIDKIDDALKNVQDCFESFGYSLTE